MSKVFFSADHHWGHANIIKLSNRPFANVEEMNTTMVNRWNEKIQPEDNVWFLGDLFFGKNGWCFDKLNGEKHLIVGNHDHRETRALQWASEPKHYHEMDLEDAGTKHRLVLFHYGIRSWNAMFRGSIHLHGHSHGKLPGFRTASGGGTLDVGVDCWNFYPITLAEIKARLLALPEYSPELQTPND